MSKLDQLMLDVFQDEADTIGDDTPFAESAGWDSLKHVELIVTLETRFNLDLTSEEIGALTSKRTARAILAAKGCDV